MSLFYRKMRPHTPDLERKSDGAAGYDLHCMADNAIIVAPNSALRVPTGISIEIPMGFTGLVLPRSSWSDRIDVIHPPIDSDYRGEIWIIVKAHAQEVQILPGKRIAQLVVLMCHQPLPVQMDKLSETKRSAGGFGSTGGVE